METPIDWTSFTKKIYIKTHIDKVYALWATAEGICSWFLKSASYTRNSKTLVPTEFVKAGDVYAWEWYNWPIKEKGSVLEANDKDKIVFSFAGDCQVVVSLVQKGDLVLVSLTQQHIPADEKNKYQVFYGCSNGWAFWLTNLKAYLEHGILLNATDIAIATDNLDCYEFINM